MSIIDSGRKDASGNQKKKIENVSGWGKSEVKQYIQGINIAPSLLRPHGCKHIPRALGIV